MTRTDRFIVPEAPARQQPARTGLRGTAGNGIRFGVLDNSKGNADHLLRLIVAGVQAAVPVAALTALRKPNSAFAAEPALIDQLAAQADLVVSAMAD